MTSGKPGDWDKWVGLWGSLIKKVQALPATSAGSSVIDYIIVDIMNEPECSDGDHGPYNINLRCAPLQVCWTLDIILSATALLQSLTHLPQTDGRHKYRSGV